MKSYYRVQADINLDAICNNIENIRAILKKGTKIMAVIKADGYGHGAIPIAKVLYDKVDFFGIAIIQEAIELINSGIDKPILNLGYMPKEYYYLMIKNNIRTAVFTIDMARQISNEAVKQNKIAYIHIKIDTGMGRIGFLPNNESINIIKQILKLPNIFVEGIFTHFACADMMDKTSVNKQIQKYTSFIEKLENENIKIPLKHVANSASIIDLPEVNFDMVRSGITTYGLYPSDEVNKEKLLLQPAMEIKTRVAYLKDVEKGTTIGYGSTFIAPSKMKIATIPIGYADGYSRSLSSKGRVLINGKSAPVIGRICMDQFMVDVTHIENVKIDDIVTIVGKDKDEYITVEEISKLSGSFNYEFVCDVSKRIPRVYYYKGKKAGTIDFYDCANIELNF